MEYSGKGKFVPYKEYLSVFIGVGGDYAAKSIKLPLIRYGLLARCFLLQNSPSDILGYRYILYGSGLFLGYTQYDNQRQFGLPAEENRTDTEYNISEFYSIGFIIPDI